MNWNGSTTPVADRIWGALPYLLPLMDALMYGDANPLFNQFPVLQALAIPLLPVLAIYRSFPFAGLLIFLGLYLGVIRNDRISRFVRVNVMQAILIDIVLFICNLILPILSRGISNPFITDILVNTVFFGIVAAFGYALVQVSRGLKPEIPAISEAANQQVR
jgi:uncharacterized membrane protein